MEVRRRLQQAARARGGFVLDRGVVGVEAMLQRAGQLVRQGANVHSRGMAVNLCPSRC